MSEGAIHRMTADEFLEWDLTAPDHRHELVDGVPVPQHGWRDDGPVAMTGASQRHDLIVVNVLGELRAKLRGGPCRPLTADVAVRIPNGQVRRPDVGVHCSAFNENAPSTAEPTLVVEVLSRSAESTDRYRKLEEYKTVPSLRHILLVDPATPQAVLWSRDAAGAWGYAVLTGLDAMAEFSGIGASLRLADIYEGLTFRPAPRLVMEPPPTLPQA